MMKKAIFLLLGIMLGLTACREQTDPNVVTQDLLEGWRLTGDTLDIDLDVTLPSVVQTDLFEAGLIPHPYLGTVEQSMLWISNHPWRYTLRFDLNPELRNKKCTNLVFEGIDTYATITLNDKKILTADNMFRSWVIPVTLNDSNNILIVDFMPYDSVQNTLYEQAEPKFPERYAVSRKAAYQHGWDWAPKYKNVGIWKPVRLTGWSEARMINVNILTDKINHDQAYMRLWLDLLSATDKPQSLTVELLCDNAILKKEEVTLHNAENHIELPFDMDEPILWWPNEMGTRHLYNFEVRLKKGNKILDYKTLTSGIKTFEMVDEPDSIGRAFYFKINGVPMYAKGANYIPNENFTSWMRRTTDRDLLIKAQKAHFNMLRVWGGGIYPFDYFYDLCDSLGILVWQDFMFAGTLYPYDSSFLNNVEAEAREQVKRLASHASLALWCGNNEVSEGYYNWGWQQSLGWSEDEDKAMKAGYDTLFEVLLAKTVNEYDGTHPYWPSSPSKGWGRPESLTQGDVHYWGVWWGEMPYEIYRDKVGRFNSEYGYQSYPDIITLQRLDPTASLSKESELIAAHQKHPRGKKQIDDFIRRYYPYPDSFDDYIYMSQLSQAYGMRIAIEAHRTAKPHNMGTLYWQLNDSWPVVSWSSIDYYGHEKALQYKLKTLFAPLLLSLDQKDGAVYATSDLRQSMNGILKVSVSNFLGNTLFAKEIELHLTGNENKSTEIEGLPATLRRMEKENAYVKLEFLRHDSLVAERFCYLALPKDLKLPKARPAMTVKKDNGVMKIDVKTDVFAKDVQLYCLSGDGGFSDNFFDLEPNTTKHIIFVPKEKGTQPSFGIRCLNDFRN